MLDNTDGELGKIHVPSLMIWGDKDTIVPRSDQEALMAGIAGSMMFVYPGVGHAIYWEQPAQVASDLVAFVEKIGN